MDCDISRIAHKLEQITFSNKKLVSTMYSLSMAFDVDSSTSQASDAFYLMADLMQQNLEALEELENALLAKAKLEVDGEGQVKKKVS